MDSAFNYFSTERINKINLFFNKKFKQLPDVPSSKIIRLPTGKDIEYVISGNGFPVLAIHGGFGGYDQSLILLKEFLPNGCQLICPSRPGYLGTPLLDNVKTIQQQTDMLIELLDYLNINKVLLLGISAGGLCLYDFSIRYPNRVQAIIAIDAISGFYPKPKQLTSVLSMSKLGILGKWMTQESLAYFPEIILKNLLKMSGHLSNDQIEEKINTLLKSPEQLEKLSNLIKSFFDYNNRSAGTLNDLEQAEKITTQFELSRIEAPALIIHGTNDEIVKFKYGVLAYEQIGSKSKEYIWIDNGIHLGYFFINKDSFEYLQFQQFIKQYIAHN